MFLDPVDILSTLLRLFQEVSSIIWRRCPGGLLHFFPSTWLLLGCTVHLAAEQLIRNNGTSALCYFTIA